MVHKTYRPGRGDKATRAASSSELVTIAEFGSRFEADTVAALAREGGFDVTVRGLTPFVVLGAEAERGAHLVLAASPEAADARRYLDEHGAQIIDDAPGDRLDWRGAAVATGSLLLLLLVTVIAIWLKGG